MKKILLLSLLVIPAVIGTMSNAQAFNGGQGGNTTFLFCDNQGGIPIGSPVHCEGFTDNKKVTDLHITITDGNGIVRDTIDIPVWTDNGPDDEDPDAKDRQKSVDFIADTAGVWEVKYVFTGEVGQRNVEIFNVVVSFLVIPESGLGTIALLGSSLAGLGAFVGLKYRKF